MSMVERSNVRSIQWRTTNEVLFPSLPPHSLSLSLSLSLTHSLILSFFFSLSVSPSFSRPVDYETSQKLDEIFEKRITFYLHLLKNTVEKSFLERYYFQNIRCTCRTMHKRQVHSSTTAR